MVSIQMGNKYAKHKTISCYFQDFVGPKTIDVRCNSSVIILVLTISGKDIAPSHFSNLHSLGTKRDTTKEYVCSIYRPNSVIFCRISFRFQVREV